MTEYEKCLQGLPFDGAQPPMSDMVATARRYMKLLRETDYDDRNARDAIFRELFGAIGTDVYIDVDFHCEYGKHIFIGNRTIINQNCTFIDNNYIRGTGADYARLGGGQIFVSDNSASGYCRRRCMAWRRSDCSAGGNNRSRSGYRCWKRRYAGYSG